MKVKLRVPNTLKDIKLSQYQQFLRETKDIEDVELSNKKSVAIFCGVPEKYIDSIKRSDYNDIVKTINTMLNEKPELQTIIRYNGRRYGFIPSLEDITVGEQADIESMIGDPQKWDKVMSVLYREIITERKGKYLVDGYTGKEQPMDLSMDIVLGSTLFFYNLLNDCIDVIQSYMKAETIHPQTLQILEQNGVGINQFTQLLEGTFLDLKRSLSYH